MNVRVNIPGMPLQGNKGKLSQDGTGFDFVGYCNKHKRQKNAAMLLLTSNRNTGDSGHSARVDEVVAKKILLIFL